MAVLGHHSRHVAAAFLSGRQIVVGLVCIAVLIVLLTGPVVGESLLGSFSAGAARVAPGTFLLGLGFLIIGLMTGVGVLDAIGACLMGAILLGLIVMHY